MGKLNYSKKQFSAIAIQRYKPWNIVRNAEFLEYRVQIPPEQLAFYDESAWEDGKTGVPNAAWGSKFERLVNVTYKKMKGTHSNLNLLASVNAVLHFDFIKGKQTATDVVRFFEQCRLIIRASSIKYIQMDSASVHTQPVVDMIRSLVNVEGEALEVIFQPTYSPHLNPVELIFGFVKQATKKDYDRFTKYPHIVLGDAIYSIPQETLQKFAEYCGVF